MGLLKDIRQTRIYADYLATVGWMVDRYEGTYIYIRKIPLLGTFIKIQRPRVLSGKVLDYSLKKYSPFQIVVEPQTIKDAERIQRLGFKRLKVSYVPSRTIILDISNSQAKILKQMKKDARASINKTANIQIVEETDTRKFREYWRSSVPIKRYIMSLSELFAMKKAFGANVVFLRTNTKGSGGVFLVADETAYYWQGFTSSSERKTLSQYQVVWQGILWAKKRGALSFDFEGIYDERFPVESWHGFTTFKKKFGGKLTDYPGAFRKTYLKNWRLF